MDSVLDQETNKELFKSYSCSRKSFNLASESGKNEIKKSLLRHQDTFRNLFGPPSYTERKKTESSISYNRTNTMNFRNSIERVIGGNYPTVKDVNKHYKNIFNYRIFLSSYLTNHLAKGKTLSDHSLISYLINRASCFK